jgi:hypothetical protein
VITTGGYIVVQEDTVGAYNITNLHIREMLGLGIDIFLFPLFYHFTTFSILCIPLIVLTNDLYSIFYQGMLKSNVTLIH